MATTITRHLTRTKKRHGFTREQTSNDILLGFEKNNKGEQQNETSSKGGVLYWMFKGEEAKPSDSAASDSEKNKERSPLSKNMSRQHQAIWSLHRRRR